jgi:hypothetical protein
MVQRYDTAEHAEFGGPSGKQRSVVVNGVKFTYGEIITMGDFFASPADMFKASKKKLLELRKLIRKSKKSSVSTAEWQKATDKQYLKLAAKNSSHFAPPNRKLITGSKSGGEDHFNTWGKWHYAALNIAAKSRKGKRRDEALAVNAFGDHFLTDAFAAGHLFNKDDAMAQFNARLAGSGSFFDDVAKKVWADKTVAASCPSMKP